MLPGGKHPPGNAPPWVFCLLFFLLPCFPPAFLHGLSDFYWEPPEIFSTPPGNFPVSAYNSRLSVIAWQEAEAPPGGTGEGRIRLSLGIKKTGEPWQLRRDIGPVYPYTGTEPAILSVTLDQQDRIFISAAVSPAQIEILVSDDGGDSFRAYRINGDYENSLTPRIFVTSGGAYLLFITRRLEQSLALYYARSEEGFFWSPFELFAEGLQDPAGFQPSHAALGNTDHVIFQALAEGEAGRSLSQLFLKTSTNGGRTWSPPRLFTDFYDPSQHTGASPGLFDNRQAHLTALEEHLFVVWERRFGTGSPRIYSALMGLDGSLIGKAQGVNPETSSGNNPKTVLYDGEPLVIWVDNRPGNNRVFLAQRGETEWKNHDLSGAFGDISRVCPALDSGGLFIFWQLTTQGMGRIYFLAPDSSVAAPRIITQNFVSGKRNRGDRARISWNLPPDPSGIMGFSYLWSKDPHALPPRQVMTSAGAAPLLEQIAPEDGAWYFTLMARDFAGNWSDVSRITFLRDTSPPPAPLITPPAWDRQGYLPSNTFSLGWNPAPDVAGYTWVLQYLGPPELFASLGPRDFAAAAERRFPKFPALLPRIMGTEHALSFTNQDNGIWSFTLAAVDEAGNVGSPSRVFFRTNKYIPYTDVSYAEIRQNEWGKQDIHIIGRGFTDGGRVNRILLDQDGEAPYDREFFLGLGEYQVLSDREITGLVIDYIPAGQYRIGIDHPRRGLYLSAPLLRVDEIGTLKIGDYSDLWEPSWRIRNEGRYVFEFPFLIIIAIFIFCGTGFIVTLRGIGDVIAESAVIRLDAAALITGDFMLSEKKKQLARIKRRGVGLRVKLASFTIILILLVVMMVSAPLYMIMIRTQEETLLQSLWDRSAVLLEGLGSGARAYLPSANIP
ncbi:MAG: signal protein, partial [Treponema sp.]|nr:signal protein [Treponema sp.]